MAYTSVIPVRRLDRTVDYVQNKEKTTPKSLEEAVDYAANRDKTESACFETGLGCTTTSAFEDMRLNTLRWHKETGVQGSNTCAASTRPARGCNSAVWKMRWPCLPALWEPLISSMMPDKST